MNRLTLGLWQIVLRLDGQYSVANNSTGDGEVCKTLASALYWLRAWYRRHHQVVPAELAYLCGLVRESDSVQSLAAQSMFKQPFQEASR